MPGNHILGIEHFCHLVSLGVQLHDIIKVVFIVTGTSHDNNLVVVHGHNQELSSWRQNGCVNFDRGPS